MPGSQKNTWNSYLNGGTSHYNFSYKNEESLQSDPTSVSQPVPQPVASNKSNTSPQIPNVPPSPHTPPAANKEQNGGKRKTKRYSRKYRHSRRK